MTGAGPFGPIVTAAGTIGVTHRLALALEPFDPAGRRDCAGVRAGHETATAPRRRRRGPGPLDPVYADYPAVPLGGSHRFLVRHTGSTSTRMRVRLDDPAGRFVPRRLDVQVWSLADVAACDPTPQQRARGPFVPAAARTLRPWLLPAAGYPVPGGATGLRLRVVRGTAPVRWPRVDAFGAGGELLGSSHGDQHGQVLLLISDIGLTAAPTVDRILIALRVYGPNPSRPSLIDPADPLADLPVEVLPRPDPAPDDPVIRGRAIPAGYVSAPADHVRSLALGELATVADLPFFS